MTLLLSTDAYPPFYLAIKGDRVGLRLRILAITPHLKSTAYYDEERFVLAIPNA